MALVPNTTNQGLTNYLRSAWRDADPKTRQDSPVTFFSLIIRAYPLLATFTAVTLASVIIAENYFDTSPWIGGAVGTGLFIAAGSILSHCFKKANDPEDLQLALEMSRDPNLQKPKDDDERIEQGFPQDCPISKAPILKGQSITVDREPYDIHYFTLGVLSMNDPSPFNPMNRQPLNDKQIYQICKFYNINIEDFKGLFNNPTISLLAEEQQAIHLRSVANLPIGDQQVNALIQIQNDSSSRLSELRITSFKELVSSHNSNDSKQVQGLLLAHHPE